MTKLVTITKFQPHQWKEYKKIRLEALQSDPIAFQTTYEQALAYSDNDWVERLTSKDCVFFFAEISGMIVGTMGVYLKGKDESIDTAVIVGVYVANSYRGQGVGKKLMETLLEEIRTHKEIKKVKLFVAETQHAAQKLYEKMGFSYIGKKEKAITFQEKEYDEFIMEREINTPSKLGSLQ